MEIVGAAHLTYSFPKTSFAHMMKKVFLCLGVCHTGVICYQIQAFLHTYHHKRRIYEMIMDECHISVPIIHKFCASALLTYLSL